MTKKNLQSKALGKGETQILKVLKDKIPRKFGDLKEKTKLSSPSLSENLKQLYIDKKIKYNYGTKEYEIENKGKDQLEINDAAAETLKNGNIQNMGPLPISSIVAIDIPGYTKDQEGSIMKGTLKMADVVFKQFYSDMKEKFPDSGRLTWTLSMDAKEAKDWLDTAEGINYRMTYLKEKGVPETEKKELPITS
jgi:hypothetical protein